MITETNKTQVAAATVDSVTSSSSVTSALPFGVETTLESSNKSISLNDAVVISKLKLPQLQNLPVGVTATETQNSPGGGSITVSGTVTDSNNILATAGDNFTLTGNQCILNTNEGNTKINGGLTIRVLGSTSTNRSVNINFNNLTMVYGNSTLISPYLDMTLAQQGGYEYDYFNAAQSTSTATGSFTTIMNGITRTRSLNNLQETFRDGDYAINGTYAYQGYYEQYAINGVMGYSKNGNTLGAGTYTTITPFLKTNYYNRHPNSGQVTFKGKSGTLRITAQSDATNVSIELDANDDGIYESNSTMTWTQLLANF